MMRATGSLRRTTRCISVMTLMAALAGCMGDGKSDSGPDAVGEGANAPPITGSNNQPPEITGVPSAMIESGQNYTFVPAASDADQDFLEFQVANKPSWAQFNTETGVLSGTPQDADVGLTGEITIAVTDGRDQRAVGPFRIRVAFRGELAIPGNTPPVIGGTPSGSVQVGKPYSFVPTASDGNGDKLRFIVSNRPSWAAFNTDTGALTGTPTAANIGVYSKITISVSDGWQTTSMPAFTVQVNGTDNRAPVITGAPMSTAQVSRTYSFMPSATDADGDTLSYSIQNKPVWASFNTSNGQLSGTPAAANVGNYANIQIQVSDGKTTSSLPAFAIAVQAPTNGAPTISGKPITTATVGSAYGFQPTGSDPDGDALGYSIQNRPTWAAFNTSTGALSGTPTAAGTSSNIIITVSDGKVTASLPAFAIVVTKPANGSPTISGSPTTTVKAGAGYSFQPTAKDPNGDTLSWSIANKPSWATFSTTTGKLSGTPGVGNVGSFPNISISVSDGKSTVTLAAFTITVSNTSQGNATLSWQAPTENDDGSALGNLAGFRIVYGTSASAMTQTIDIANPSVNTYVVNSLTPATWYFAVKAYNTTGGESSLSAVASKTIN